LWCRGKTHPPRVDKFLMMARARTTIAVVKIFPHVWSKQNFLKLCITDPTILY
jgi:hypothetical protein